MGQLRRDLEILRLQRDEIVEEQVRLEEEEADLAARFAAARVRDAAPAGGVGNIAEPNGAEQIAPAAPIAAANRRQADNNGANDNNNNRLPNAAGRVISVTFGIAARNLLSALVAPVIGHLVGRALHHWALNSRWLGSSLMKKILGIGMAGQVNSIRASSGFWGRNGLGLGPVMPIGLRLGVEELDPIWCAIVSSYFRSKDVRLTLCALLCAAVLPIVSYPSRWRNAVGMAAYVFASDVVGLAHLWLVLRERRQRKIVDRNFRGIDPSSLDLIESQ